MSQRKYSRISKLFWFISSSRTWKQHFEKNITKVNYLRTFLRGPALASISDLSLTSENYKQAIEILEKRYGKKQLLITLHTDQLLSISPITSTSDIKKIRETYDKIETNVQNLRSLDIDTSQYDPVFISIVMSKLPEDMKLQISRSVPISHERHVDELLALYYGNSNLEKCEIYRRSREPDNFTGAALFSGGNRSGQPFTSKCTYCRKNHKSHECNLITDPRSQKAILRAKSKCFICLRGNHRMNECQWKLVCFRCKQRHDRMTGWQKYPK